MKTLFVHRLLPMPRDSFDPTEFGFDGPPEDAFHVSRSFGPEALRGVALGRVVFVDLHPGELSFARVQAITAAMKAGSRMAAAKAEKTTGLDFGDAVRALKAGKRVARAGWNGKGMFLEMQLPDAHSKMGLPYAYLTTGDGKRVPWTASQTDVFAEDWEIVARAEPVMPGPWYKPLPPELDPNLIAAGAVSADKICTLSAAQIGAISADKLVSTITREPDPLVEGQEIAVRNVRVGDITGTRLTVFADQEVGPEAAQALRLIFTGQPA